MHPKYISRCRVCGEGNLVDIIDLGEQYLQGSFLIEGSVRPPMRQLPTRLVRCDVTASESACGLVQLAHTFPPAVLYSNYWYRSGTNQTMRDHLKDVVDNALTLIGPLENGKVLDIGCNDGTLLAAYPDSIERYGVDPSDIARSIEFPVHLVNTVFPSERATQAFSGIRFDVITSIAMFYDLEDPVAFAREVGSMLANDGVWVLEMSYLPLMLLTHSFDTICHEHLEYYSLAVLERIFKEAGLRCVRAEINEINGGSIRCYVAHNSSTTFDRPDDERFLHHLRLREFELALDSEAPYTEFRQATARLRDNTVALLKDLKQQGKRIHVYGASTKGNVLLQWYGLDNTVIDAAADRNPHKVGGRTLGTDIPIISEAQSRADQPDVYLVLPWHFKAEFLEREADTIRNGAAFIFPLPTLEVVSAENYDSVVAALPGSPEKSAGLLDLIEAAVSR